jgi:valyl-tRNA synthetase
VYLEVLKSRFQNAEARPAAQRVLAHALDTLLRLLHPMVPFITEEIWQLLGQAAPRRGLDSPGPPSETIMLAPWPLADKQHHSEEAEAKFRLFRDVLGAVNEIRSRQNIPPKAKVSFSVKCAAASAPDLEALSQYFLSMANASPTVIGPSVEPPPSSAQVSIGPVDVYVDLQGHIDPAAERARLAKQIEKLGGLIQGKEKKLSNESFTARAPADVVLKERESLSQMKEQLAAAEAALSALP